MTTGQNIIDALPLASGVLRPADELNAVNAAIHAGWPAFKVWQYATSAGTFDSETFEYSLSALTDLSDYGIQKVYVNPATATSAPNFQITSYDLRRDDSTWTLLFPKDVVSAYDTQTFDVWYVAKPATLTALSETLAEELPFDYMTYYVSWWAYSRSLSDQNVDRSYRDLMLMYEDLWREARRKGQTLAPSLSYRPGKARIG